MQYITYILLKSTTRNR